MAKIEIDHWGTKRYFDDNNEHHREDGPSVIKSGGTKFWFVNGKQSSSVHPSDVFQNGHTIWFLNSFVHRDDGPAEDNPNGLKFWVEKDKAIWPKLK